MTRLIVCLTVAVLLAAPAAWACPACGCEAKTAAPATAPQHEGHAHTHAEAKPEAPKRDAKFEADRKAILAMAGEFEVDFQFQETVAIEPGYELKEPYTSGATEFVEVIEDTGDYISLQHVLVMKNKDGESIVVKHWRQDWRFEDTTLTEFRGNRTWEKVTLPEAKVKGTWSQAVYQVDDSPRYEGYGVWTHTGGRSAWESSETWRPLPRREFSKRDDYQVLVARNRHTITPAGWVHEQDNFKLVLDEEGNPAKVLAHESGLNVYDTVDGVDFAAGRAYWEDTQAYWQDVRAVWAEVWDDADRVTLKGEVDGDKMYQVMFALAKDVREAEAYNAEAMRPQIRQRIEAFIAQP